MAGFDWQSFSTAFMNSVADNITERKDAAKTWKEQQQELALKNIPEAQKRRQLSDKAMGYYNYLSENGATNDQIQAAVSSGADGIVKFAEVMQKAVTLNGGRPLAKNEVSTLITIPEGFEPINIDVGGMESLIQRSYGGDPTTKGPGEQSSASFWDQLSGYGAKDRARSELDKTAIYDGYTALDLNEMAQTSAYTSLQPSTFVSFQQNFFTPDVAEGAVVTLDRLLAKIKLDPEYIRLTKDRDVLLDRIKNKLDDAESTDDEKKEYNEVAIDIPIISAKLNKMRQDAAGATMAAYYNQYGPKFDAMLGGLMEDNFGSEWRSTMMGGDGGELPVIETDNKTPVVEGDLPPIVDNERVTRNGTIIQDNPDNTKMRNPKVVQGKQVTFTIDEQGNILGANVEGIGDLESDAAKDLYRDFMALPNSDSNSESTDSPVAPVIKSEDTGLVDPEVIASRKGTAVEPPVEAPATDTNAPPSGMSELRYLGWLRKQGIEATGAEFDAMFAKYKELDNKGN